MNSRGLRNCNPLNIRRVAGTTWKGQRDEQTDNAFVQFESIEWGIRAAFVLLRTYSTKYHANCIRDIISRWAPPTENDTERYIRNVCFWSGLGGLQRLTEQDWPKLVRAMARQECGEVLSEETINRGFELFKHPR
ncbi:MAG: hypothetical protein J6T78_09810 [Bacteroidaceae bacterium]|nr:hypothetical protein [Bacteroidaceae bacterium]